MMQGKLQRLSGSSKLNDLVLARQTGRFDCMQRACTFEEGAQPVDELATNMSTPPNRD